jgi:CheY-like chemotaxis protein
MKVLVIDDTQVNLVSALRTLVGHDVTICSTHKDAYEHLNVRYDEERKKALCEQYMAQGVKFNDYYFKVLAETRLPYWDVVLVDHNMPAYSEASNRREGEVMMVGWQMVLIAALNGAKYAAVVTDDNHHADVTSAMLDPLGSAYWSGGPVLFVINGAKVGFWHSPNEGSPDGKDWGKVLEALLKN